MASGGYRRPTNPAPASGPGRLSKRTDGGPSQKLMVAPGQAYGERQQDLAQERTAPMVQADNTPQLNLPAMQQPSQPPTPSSATATATNAAFSAATQRPTEPVTHGVDIGAGGGPEVLAPPVQQQMNPQGPMTQMLSTMGGLSGSLAAVYSAAASRGV